LGYFVDDDYTRLHVPDVAAAALARPLGPDRGFLQRIDRVADYAARFAADVDAPGGGATPLEHPYVDPSGILWLAPEREVALTLLMEPYSRVHVTIGLLPRKEIGMRRAWVEPALARLMPSFRFGPVLVDPQQIRMPVPRQVEGQWSWSHRTAVGRWDNPAIVQANADAGISDDPAVATEGWLSLRRGEPT